MQNFVQKSLVTCHRWIFCNRFWVFHNRQFPSKFKTFYTKNDFRATDDCPQFPDRPVPPVIPDYLRSFPSFLFDFEMVSIVKVKVWRVSQSENRIWIDGSCTVSIYFVSFLDVFFSFKTKILFNTVGQLKKMKPDLKFWQIICRLHTIPGIQFRDFGKMSIRIKSRFCIGKNVGVFSQ